MEGYIDEYMVPRITGIKVSGLKEDISLEPILDTGFNGEFSLPKRFLSAAKVQFIGTDYFELADGRVVEKEIFVGEIIIKDTVYLVEMNITDSDDALIGTGVLKKKVAVFDFKRNKVNIKK